MTTDSSVVMALSELQQIEAERVADEARAGETRRREAEARELERVRAEAEAARAEIERAAERERARAEAEARARVELEATRDRSLDALRAEVALVQREREAMRHELEARIAAASSLPPRRTPWALAFGLSSVVAAGLAGLLVAQQPVAPPAPAPAAPVVIVAPPVAPPSPEIVPVVPAAEVVADAPEARPRVRAPRGPRTTPRSTREGGDALERDLGLDDESEEVLSDRFLREATRDR